MSSLQSLPPKYRSVPSVQSLAERYDRYKLAKRGESPRGASSVGMVEQIAATGLGAALSGVLTAKGVSDGAVGAVGGALVAAGVAYKQPTLVNAANGIIAPLIAKWAARLAMGGN